MKLSAKILVKRASYGGRKGRRAWRRLLGYRVNELNAGGVTVRLDMQQNKMSLVVDKP